MSSWEPWEKYKHLRVERLDISGPPCASCLYWRPVPTFTPGGEFDGVRLCHASEQQKDFSCYRRRWTDEEERMMQK